MFDSNYEQIEQKVLDRPGSYQGLSEEALLTSLEDFKAIFETIPNAKQWVELGSGHGRGPLLFAQTYPEKSSIGIEFERSRFEISLKLQKDYNLSNVTF